MVKNLMSNKNGKRKTAPSAVRRFHLWPLISRTGIYNFYRRRKFPDTIVSLDVVLTECCTLRCRNCANLMQYYKHPENLDAEETISALEALLKSFRISRLNLLGGEPFVFQKGLISVLEYLKSVVPGRVDEVVIITNGTIIPTEECLSAMREIPELKVVFSNYGELSSKIEELKGILDRLNIRFEIVDNDIWWDFGGLEKRDEKESSIQHRYDACFSRRHCTTLYRGKLYVCPRQAHGIRLGAVPDDALEYVDLLNTDLDRPGDLHIAVYRLIDRKKRISACAYCGCDNGIEIPRAVQAERPLDAC